MIVNTSFQIDQSQLTDEHHSQMQTESSLQSPKEVGKVNSENMNYELVERVIHLCEFILKNARNDEALSAAKACKEKNWQIEELYNISELDISGRRLTELPPDLDILKNMDELIANANKLSSLPNYIINLPKLRRLKLAGNLFEEFPSILIKPQMCGIKKVFLANNTIYDLPIEAKSILIYPYPYYNSWV